MYNDTVKKVSLYLIANKVFDNKLKLKAFDQSKKEIGRSSVKIKFDEDDAKFIDFIFDDRTPLLQADHFEISYK